MITGISHENAVLHTSRAYSGFSEQHSIVLLTDGAGSILPGSERY